jgi:hypothetical protein
MQQQIRSSTQPEQNGPIAGIVIVVVFVLVGTALGIVYAFFSNPCGGQPSIADISKAMIETAKEYPMGLNMTKVSNINLARRVVYFLQRWAKMPCPELITASQNYVRLCSDEGYLEACTSSSAADVQLLKMSGTVDGCPLTVVPVTIYQHKDSTGRLYDGLQCSLIRDTLSNEANLERRRNKQMPFGPNAPPKTS